MRSAMLRASAPERRTTPMPARARGVEIATMVSESCNYRRPRGRKGPGSRAGTSYLPGTLQPNGWGPFPCSRCARSVRFARASE